MAPRKVVVVGAGVVGLTTAVKIQERGGYDVLIVANVLPDDPNTINYASQWAAALHADIVSDEKNRAMERQTFDVYWKLSQPDSLTERYFLRIPQTEFFGDPELSPPPLGIFPDYREIPKDELPPGVAFGKAMTTFTIDCPHYLLYLADRFVQRGGRIVRGTVQHIQHVVAGGENLFSDNGRPIGPDAVVVCPGLGARFLGGVEDKDVYPIRGQTVLVKAPWIKSGMSLSEADGTITYITPRSSGIVVLGGVMDADDWHPHPWPKTTRQILERSLALCPELVPLEIREKREPTIEDLMSLIVDEGCGLRPARKGGIRLEVEWLHASESTGGRKVPVVFNYGHSSYGYQVSWGSAEVALKLLEEALQSL